MTSPAIDGPPEVFRSFEEFEKVFLPKRAAARRRANSDNPLRDDWLDAIRELFPDPDQAVPS